MSKYGSASLDSLSALRPLDEEVTAVMPTTIRMISKKPAEQIGSFRVFCLACEASCSLRLSSRSVWAKLMRATVATFALVIGGMRLA